MPASKDPNETSRLDRLKSDLKGTVGWVEKGTITLYMRPPKEEKTLVEVKKAVTKSFNKPKENTYELEVDFNPNTISISGVGGGYALQRNLQDNKKENDKDKGDIQDDYGQPARIEVSFSLIFDTMSISKAFILEKLDNITSISNAVHIAKDSLSGKTDSVAPIVEGIIACLVNDGSNKMSFTWGKMVFSGRMNNVEATYTMFNPQGTPVRAEVRVHMICIEELEKDDGTGKNIIIGNKAAWLKMYDYMLKDAGGDTGLGGKVKSAGNWLSKHAGSIFNV